MSPRPYQLGRRQAAVDATRAKVIRAARELLTEPAGSPAFGIDAVAKRADVARATVYYQFGSKSGLLEALFDALADGGGMDRLAASFTKPDPLDGLRHFVSCFGRFWSSDRLALRRVRALAALDPDVGQVVAARDERRRLGLNVLLGRIAADKRAGAGAPDGTPVHGVLARQVRIAHVLTSFETFDALAGPDQEPDDVVPLIVDLVLRLIGHT
ncbi:MAG: TetR/AcrR family transcriptional regulator [Actinocrinis sp.]